MAAHEVHEYEAAWLNDDYLIQTHQRELYEMDDDFVDNEHGIIIDQPADDDPDLPPPRGMMVEAMRDTSSLWQPIPLNSAGAACKIHSAAAEDFLAKSCSRSLPQDDEHRRVEEGKMTKQVRTSADLLANEAGASAATPGNDFLLETENSWALPLPAPPSPSFPMDPSLSQSTIVRIQKTAKISNVIAHEMAACKTPSTESLANKLPAAGLRRHLKQEQGTHLVSSETPVVLSKICELFLFECCEAAVQHSSSDEIRPTDFAKAFRQDARFRFLTQD